MITEELRTLASGSDQPPTPLNFEEPEKADALSAVQVDVFLRRYPIARPDR
jgi:hypothetical protein